MTRIYLEDCEGYYVTEFDFGDTELRITCSKDFERYRKISIIRNEGSNEERLKVETIWLAIKQLDYDGHICFGELEVIEEEDGIIYIDADFGVFRIHSNNSTPPLKKNACKPCHQAI